MVQLWNTNEEKSADDELVVTEHRDADGPVVTGEDEQLIETSADGPKHALEELGEDVSSSPAERGTEGVVDAEQV